MLPHVDKKPRVKLIFLLLPALLLSACGREDASEAGEAGNVKTVLISTSNAETRDLPYGWKQ